MKLRCSTIEAVGKLLAGGVGVLPTDTIYGLVAPAADPTAVARLNKLKPREAKPGTLIAATIDQLAELGIPRRYLRAVEHLWPNPLSIALPFGDRLPYLQRSGVPPAVRVVADPAVRKLLQKTGPLLTTSANAPGQPSANTIGEAYDYFGDQVDFYVDGGDMSGRPASTLIRIVDDAVEVLREGSMDLQQINELTRFKEDA